MRETMHAINIRKKEEISEFALLPEISWFPQESPQHGYCYLIKYIP
jgi:hypothetical protein